MSTNQPTTAETCSREERGTPSYFQIEMFGTPKLGEICASRRSRREHARKGLLFDTADKVASARVCIRTPPTF